MFLNLVGINEGDTVLNRLRNIFSHVNRFSTVVEKVLYNSCVFTILFEPQLNA